MAESPLPALDTNPSTVASTSASMPVTPKDESEVEQGDEVQDIKMVEPNTLDPEAAARQARLSFLLEKSGVYAEIIGKRMEAQRIERAKAELRAAVREANKKTKQVEIEANEERRSGRAAKPTAQMAESDKGVTRRATTRKRKVDDVVAAEKPAIEAVPLVEIEKQEEAAEQTEKQYSFRQPSLITGAKLRDYQLAGVQWMISLYENGLNGILADEMGLGKTLQTISFLAHLRSKGTWGPFLIVCPLSVLHNWVTEFEKFAPTIPVIMYHGTPQHRAELRAEHLQAPSGSGIGGVKGNAGKAQTTAKFPIVVTTYEITMKDRAHLSGLLWKYIVVDEGHRLKNLDCKLIRELKTYTSANRLILTGTPLHNNLSELWSLLNFILPDIFDDVDAFQEWFDLADVNTGSAIADKGSIVRALHSILKPFLLRRMKVDVEKDLPPKKEYLLYAPLTVQQKEMYQAIASRRIRQYLVDAKSGTTADEPIDVDAAKPPRKKARVNYAIQEDDDKYIDDLENGKNVEPSGVVEKSAAEVGKNWQIAKATKQVNNMKLQNIVMQLRKVSCHPFLFDWPADPKTGQLVVNDDLIDASGKMLLLNRLLDELFKRGHKVLLFSQFTTMLDVIEDWATEFKGWKICRIDGSTSQESRREQMHEFNNGGESPDACQLFILSTRAGGLGINLVSADTVIFFDQDWNPQMDLQAQDRAHRIGQTKPVLIFRLISEHTIEQKILEKAGSKRKLEELVISQGKFGKVVDENGNVLLGKSKNKQESLAEAAAAMLALESEKINIVTKDDKVISDEDLDQLLDRSPAAFAREKGWSAQLGSGGKKDKKKSAFEVFVPGRDEAADGLAAMFGDDDPEA